MARSAATAVRVRSTSVRIYALRHRRHPSVLLHHRRDDRHLFGRDGAVGEGGRESGQVVQRPAVAHQLPGGGGAEPTVAAQPRLHGFQAAVLSSLLELRGPDRARQLGVEPVLRLQELGDPVELLPRCQAADVVGGQCIERRLQLAHRHLPPFERVYEFYRSEDLTAP